ncbi:MAG TPA: hypothetical protein VFP50_07630, partial [Anaeromyxobacteraceae bacterium]|nr:hypothetical protein [Anaeromyxobacteraceae bacterium]
LVARHGEAERARAERGVRQAAAAWRPADGDAAAFQAFAVEQFAPAGPALEALFGRLEASLEQLDGHAVEVNRELSRFAQLDLGPMQPVDALLAAHDASAHLVDDLFDGKVAFAALLNFPLSSLEERLRDGAGWTRRQWAEARLAGRFARRVPADVNQRIARAAAASDLYVAGYDVYAHHLLGPGGERPFEQGKRLLSHWNLRDEVKAQYAQEGGLARQRLLARVMERIVTQTIPRAAVNDPTVDWDPAANTVKAAPAGTIEGGRAPRTAPPDGAREPDTRYAMLLEDFRAVRAADPYSPAAPTHIARKFELEREIPEARVVALLEEVLGAPEVRRVAEVIRRRLGRPLEPFDVWYDGFRPRTRFTEADLDARTRARYPTPAAFAADLPRLLGALGFAPEKAAWLAAHVEVDPARGSGHALGAGRRGDKPHLRTRVGPDGMDYKGFNIAVHELGHNVEQCFSLYQVDSTLLAGVPNTAFTEALAFAFQARDLEVLGLGGPPDPEARRLLAMNDLWMTYEIAGVALVDLGVWRWMYAHPRATPSELREATLRLARDTWNRWYAPVLGTRDSPLLAIYSHMIHSFLYLPDYPLGHLIAAQLEEHLSAQPPGAFGAEIERMASFGSVAPDLWMRHAVGSDVSAKPLLRAAARALEAEAR